MANMRFALSYNNCNLLSRVFQCVKGDGVI